MNEISKFSPVLISVTVSFQLLSWHLGNSLLQTESHTKRRTGNFPSLIEQQTACLKIYRLQANIH